MGAIGGTETFEDGLQEAFQALVARLGFGPRGASLWSDLRARYSESHRAYHTLQHLSESHAHLAAARATAHDADLVEFALFAHDVIYDPRRDDNERRSGEWARRALLDGGRTSDYALRAHALVVATRHDAIPADADAQLLCDIDLAVLAAPRARFDEYETQIRSEYEWVPEPLFRSRRAELIERFLARSSIYGTQHFRDSLEEAARSNLQRSLAALRD